MATAYKLPTFPPDNEDSVRKEGHKLKTQFKKRGNHLKDRQKYWQDKNRKSSPDPLILLQRIELMQKQIEELQQNQIQLNNGMHNIVEFTRDRLLGYHQWVNSIKREMYNYVHDQHCQWFGQQGELMNECVMLLDELQRLVPPIKKLRNLIGKRVQLRQTRKRLYKQEADKELMLGREQLKRAEKELAKEQLK